MLKILREPLTHFLFLGLLVFMVDRYWTGGQSDDEREIVVSSSVLARLDDTWRRTTGSDPAEEDRLGLIAQYVQDEALAREAARLGLSENDEIIKRRLAQKMRFVATGGEAPADPSDSEVKNWFENNRERFNISERRSFNHIYFSPERHGDQLENVATTASKELKNGAAWKSLGDPFMQKRTYVTVPLGEVTRAFGPDFAKAIFNLPKGQWSMPIESAFGLHIVRIEAIDKAAKADYLANRDRIRDEFINAKSEANAQKEIDRIVKRYRVTIADTD